MKKADCIRFEEFHLKGMPLFKDQAFRLDASPLSLVLGRNQDSSNQNPNAVGKSFFFSQLFELLLGEPLIGNKRDIVRKGTRTLTISRDGHRYVIVQSFAPRETIAISRDGKDLAYRELSKAREKLRELIPYNAEELQTLVYLDSRVPHPLARGDTAARKDFFAKFFRLYASNTIRKVIKSELDDILAKEGQLKEVKENVRALRAELEGKDVDGLESKLKTLQSREIKLREDVEANKKIQRVLDDYEEHRPMLDKLLELGIKDAKGLAQAEEKVEAELKTFRAVEQAWMAYDKAQEYAEESQKSVKEATEALGEVKKPKAELSATKEKLKAVAVEIEELDQLKSKLLRRKSKCKEEATELAETLEALGKKISEGKQKDGKCPTCGGPYEDEHLAKSLASWKAKRRETEERQLEVEALLDKTQRKLDGLPTGLEDKESRLKERKRLLAVLVENSDILSVEKPKAKRSEVAESLERLGAELKLLHKGESALDAYSAWKALPKEVRTGKREDATDLLIRISERIGAVKTELDEVKTKSKTLSELKARRLELKAIVEEKPVLELLLQATSKKNGYESIKIRTVCARLEQQVNKYARLVFPENFSFKFELETQFNITVTRPYGKREITSDVRKLSGAEALLFNLILLPSLLAFIPKKLRSNLLVLDEPTAAMGQEMIDSFVKFLPVLNSVIPNIVVITPMPSNPYPGAKTFTVVKKNGWSKFVEGAS